MTTGALLVASVVTVSFATLRTGEARSASIPRAAQLLSHVRPAASTGPSAGTLTPPPIPPAGQAYLGAWVQPNSGSRSPIALETELSELGNFEAEMGRPPALVHVYQSWNFPVSNSLLDAISSTGAIPIVDWACPSGGTGGTTSDIVDNTVVNGTPVDTFIQSFAQQMKAYAKPVFLRWMWEFNLTGSTTYADCIQQGASVNGPADGAMYAAAWKVIRNIFTSVGATNVAFAWNPGLAGNTSSSFLSSFWPGAQNVDWVGVDGYSRPTPSQGGTVPPNPYFAQMFTTAYKTLSGPAFAASVSPPLPMMIGETGATNQADVNGNDVANHQYNYLVGTKNSEGILETLQGGSFPDIRALNYFDGTNDDLGDNGQWTLMPQPFVPGGLESGFSGYAALGASAYFSFMGG